MEEIGMKEIKEKFQTLQNVVQSYKEEKIALESQMTTLKSQYDEEVGKLLELTGKDSLESAVEYYKDNKLKLDEKKKSLIREINGYLDTVEDPDEVSGDKDSMFSEDILGGLL